MKLTLADPSAVNLVRSYSSSEVRVGDRVLGRALLVGPRVLMEDFAARHPAQLTEADVQRMADCAPELAIIGWAGGQTFLSPAQRRWFAERALPVGIMELGAACRTYNVLVSDGRQPVALLFPERDT
jgi:uncharacterized protein